MARNQSTKAPPETSSKSRKLAVIFGDQLDCEMPLLARLDPSHDVVLMMEVSHESRYVPSHVQRTVLFFAAMRHFAEHLRGRGLHVRYVAIDDPENTHSFSSEVERAVNELNPSEIVCTWPGEWRVLEDAKSWADRFGVLVTILPDKHFIAGTDEFSQWAKGRRDLTMEFFYREQRRKTGYLMTGSPAKPEGGTWNFDAENRESFGKKGPNPPPPMPLRFETDAITKRTIKDVRRLLPDLPGHLHEDSEFNWPVTREQALASLKHFVKHRLSNFGPYEDAMWTDTLFVYHSVLSSALNLKLLNPRECSEAAIEAYKKGKAPLQSVEAFVRQIIGWREFIRGIYWLEGPDYAMRNGLEQHGALPEFYWNANTDMNCMKHCISQVLDLSYGHHIQRLMVTGNFALTSGVHPKTISDWYLGMYVDGIDWVTLPNTLGMVMHADRRPSSAPSETGLVGTKPYASTGKYIERMSNYCKSCKYDPATRTGPNACPFTVFYWDFLLRNRTTFSNNQRMSMMYKNVDQLSEQTRVEITIEAKRLRKRFGIDK
ncbi:MAG: cryptochrome/photolyase family protein [Phycisphaerales bacterium]